MRTTNNMMVNNMINYMTTNLYRMNKYEQQLSTGKKIQVPSDDPIVAARALKLRTDVSEIKQFKTNTKDAQSWMETTGNALTQIGDVFQRMRELTVQASNGSLSKDDMINMKQEVGQLKTQTIQIANTTYAGRYIFSGFSTDSKLVNDDGNFAVPVSNKDNIKYEIGVGDNININVLGNDLFNDGTDITEGTKGNVVSIFEELLQNLNDGNNVEVSNRLEDIDKIQQTLLRVTADVGARVNRIDLTSNRLDSDEVNFTKLMSENEDADMAETIMKLKNEENVYKASMAGGARIIQPSLIDFLK